MATSKMSAQLPVASNTLDWYPVAEPDTVWRPVYTKGEGVAGTQNISEVWRKPGNQTDNGSYAKVM